MQDNNTATETVTFDIPASAADALEAELVKLAKRATRLKLTPPTWVWGEGRMIEQTYHAIKLGRKVTRAVACVTLTVTREVVSFAGWRVAGRADYVGDTTNILVSMAPGLEHSERTKTLSSMTCDHCRKARRRAAVVIVRHEDGAEKVVGKGCLVDFVGDASAVNLAAAADVDADLAAMLAAASRDFGGEDEGGWGGGGGGKLAAWELKRVVAIAFYDTLANGGWRSSKFEWSKSTSFYVSEMLTSRKEEWAKERTAMLASELWPRCIERADAALAWVREASADSDFMHNLKVIANSETVGWRQLGLTVAIVPAYDRELVYRKEKASTPESKHVGTVGERMDFGVCTVHTWRRYESDYGGGLVITFRTAEGSDLVWFTGLNDLETGDTVDLAARVKGHSEYKGRAQTTITRATFKVLKRASEAENG